MRGVLEIKLFGGFNAVFVQGDQKEIIRFRTRKGKILLAYLATFPGYHSRAELSKIIFHNISSSKSLLQLRVELHSIRHLLKNMNFSSILIVNRDFISLNTNEILIDINLFDQLVEHAAHVDEASRISLLEQACQLYTGDYMAGFDASWIHSKRQIYRDLFLKACEDLCLLYTKYGKQHEAYLLIQHHSNHLSDQQKKKLIKIISNKNHHDEEHNIKSSPESIQYRGYRVPIGMLTLAALYRQHGLIGQSTISRCLSMGGALIRRSNNLLIAVFGDPSRATKWLASEIEADQNLSGALTFQIWDDEDKSKNINILQQLVNNINPGWLVCTESVAYWLQRENKWFLQEIRIYLYTGSYERLFAINPKPYVASPFRIVKFPLIKRQLPALSGNLFGREPELQAMREWLNALSCRRAPRLLTITGVRGVGKTYLVLTFAHEIAPLISDDIIFISLENVHNIKEFKFAILQAFYEDPHMIHVDIDQITINKKSIIILDHVDRIRTEIKNILSEFLSKNKNIKIIATSRIPIGLPEEQVIPLLPLPLPPEHLTNPADLQAYACINLFLDEARQVRHDFHLSSSNAPQVAALCRHTGGIPGVIKLFARRINVYSLSNLLDIAKDNMINNIDAMIAWNFHSLPEAQQRILCYLSIFKNYWTLDEIGEIIQEPLLHEYIERLLASGLVVAKYENDPYLFMIPPSIREFANRYLDKSEEVYLKRRYISYFTNIFKQFISENCSNYSVIYDKLQYMIRYKDHLLTCIEWAIELGEIELITQLIPSLISFLELSGIIHNVLQLYEKIFNNQNVSKYDNLNLMNAFAYLYFRIGNISKAEQIYSHAYELATKHRLPTSAAEALIGLAGIALDRVLIPEAEAILKRVLSEYNESLTTCLRAHALLRLGHAYAAQLKLEIACQTIEQACALYRQIGEKRFLALALNALGSLKIKVGDIKHAEYLIKESLDLLIDINDKVFLAYALLRLGDLHMEHKKYEDAKSIYYESINISKNNYIIPAQRAALRRLGELYYLRRQYRMARRMFKEACMLANEQDSAYTALSIEKIWYAFLNDSLNEAKHLLLQYIEYSLERRTFSSLDSILILLSLIYKKQRCYQVSYKLLKFSTTIGKTKKYKSILYKIKMKINRNDNSDINEMDRKILNKVNSIMQEIGFDDFIDI